MKSYFLLIIIILVVISGCKHVDDPLYNRPKTLMEGGSNGPAIECYSNEDCPNGQTAPQCTGEYESCYNVLEGACNNPGEESSFCFFYPIGPDTESVCHTCEEGEQCLNGSCVQRYKIGFMDPTRCNRYTIQYENPNNPEQGYVDEYSMGITCDQDQAFIMDLIQCPELIDNWLRVGIKTIHTVEGGEELYYLPYGMVYSCIDITTGEPKTPFVLIGHCCDIINTSLDRTEAGEIRINKDGTITEI